MRVFGQDLARSIFIIIISDNEYIHESGNGFVIAKVDGLIYGLTSTHTLANVRARNKVPNTQEKLRKNLAYLPPEQGTVNIPHSDKVSAAFIIEGRPYWFHIKYHCSHTSSDVSLVCLEPHEDTDSDLIEALILSTGRPQSLKVGMAGYHMKDLKHTLHAETQQYRIGGLIRGETILATELVMEEIPTKVPGHKFAIDTQIPPGFSGSPIFDLHLSRTHRPVVRGIASSAFPSEGYSVCADIIDAFQLEPIEGSTILKWLQQGIIASYGGGGPQSWSIEDDELGPRLSYHAPHPYLNHTLNASLPYRTTLFELFNIPLPYRIAELIVTFE